LDRRFVPNAGTLTRGTNHEADFKDLARVSFVAAGCLIAVDRWVVFVALPQRLSSHENRRLLAPKLGLMVKDDIMINVQIKTLRNLEWGQHIIAITRGPVDI
jgi:hypothetical protein